MKKRARRRKRGFAAIISRTCRLLFATKKIRIFIAVIALLCVIAGIKSCGGKTTAAQTPTTTPTPTPTPTMDVSFTDSEPEAYVPPEPEPEPDTESSLAAPVEAESLSAWEELNTPRAKLAELDIPEYDGQPWVDLPGAPYPTDDLFALEPGQIVLSKFDELGRAGQAMMCTTFDRFPQEERGSIGQIKPAGWHQNKYAGIIDENPPYLYNRCHLLMWAMSGNNAPENLITGTRYFNVKGMLPTEEFVAAYAEATYGKIYYRVTPVYDGDNLIASGAIMEAYADDGALSLYRYAYNVQPGIVIDYKTGENWAESDAPEQTDKKAEEETKSYVLNTNTMKFHSPSCSSVGDIAEHNRQDYSGNREELIEQGYAPCGICHP